VDYTGFIGRVEGDTGLARADAYQAVRATLETLAERISGGQARDIAAQLPTQLRPWLGNAGKPQAFDLDEAHRHA
jgi:uncharacterized protein (DUF2267 family)